MKTRRVWIVALGFIVTGLMVAGVRAQQRPVRQRIRPEDAARQPAILAGDPAGARYYSIPAWDFCAHRHRAAVGWTHDEGSVGMLGSGDEQEGMNVFGTAVHLPDGAVIWGWRAWVRDSNPKARMDGLGLTNFSPSPGTSSQIGATHETTIEHNSPEVMLMRERSLNVAVNNKDHSYSMRFDTSGSKVELLGAVIIYTMPD